MTIRAAIWGTGRMGVELAKAAIERDWIELVAAIVFDPAKEGRDLAEIAGLDRPTGAKATRDVAAVLARPDLDLVFYTGIGSSAEIAGYMKQILVAGKDAVTLSGLVHPATALGPEGARELDAAARASGRRAVGTGIAPGFLVDVLPVVWLSTAVDFRRVRARMTGNMNSWGPGVLRAYGIGMSPAEITPPASRVSMKESVALISEAMNLALDRIEETNEPLISTTHRGGFGFVVEPGTVTGFRRRFVGIVSGEERVVLEWSGAFLLDPEADGLEEECSVEVEGGPYAWLKANVDGGMFVDPYPATAARGLAVVPGLLTMAPGLYNGAQVPFAAI